MKNLRKFVFYEESDKDFVIVLFILKRRVIIFKSLHTIKMFCKKS